jgi:hypothetical protein
MMEVASPEARAELQLVLSGALNTDSVLLPDNVLVHQSVLIIEPARVRDASGVPVQGRETRRPNHFELVKSGSQCVLVHKETSKRYPLSSVRCKPR